MSEIDTQIKTLGQCKIDSQLPYRALDDLEQVQVFVDKDCSSDIEPQILSLEAAGPRKKLYFNPTQAKCAIVTCGGLCPGINDVIRAIVMEAYHAYHVPSVIGIPYGLEGFIHTFSHKFVELTPETVSDIHLFGGTILGSSRGPQDSEDIVDTLERCNVNVLFVIGGDGTMKAAQKINKSVLERGRKIAVIGIPKTIDNDINFIPQSFGFETAVFKATEAIECAHTEACGVPNGIGLVKLMGRESGFIAAQATLAMKEVNFVLVPEAHFVMEGPGGFLEALESRLRHRGHAVVVTAEGAGQHLLEQNSKTDASGNVVLGDIAQYLRQQISIYLKERNFRHTIKYIDPSYIIRSVPANSSDKVYCGFLGQYAVHAAMAGRTGMVVAKVQGQYVHLPFELVTRSRRKLNINSDLWRAVLESTGQGNIKGMLPED
ncbi:MAG: ATP-dependent 6-phosphofructokinase [Desulfovibrionaceae bacterium]|nr:ATP-dependent 6-phosphofructokinase [Desulfovibrionaceae bacterium]